jgi:hypothetical protein
MQRSKKRSLYDHLIGAGEQRRRHRETECLGSLGVEPGLLLNGSREEIYLKRKPSLSDPVGALGNRYAMLLVRCIAQSIGIAKRRALLKDYRVEMPA